MYVYLNDGDIQEIEGATCLSFVANDMLVQGNDGIMISFARCNVYFASFTLIAPPVLF
jgi:hypothetical protein